METALDLLHTAPFMSLLIAGMLFLSVTLVVRWVIKDQRIQAACKRRHTVRRL